MKRKLFLSLLVFVFALGMVGPAFAVKPVTAATFYKWHLSGDVMPVPPYGSLDIPGSDTASKLIVVQPSGTTEVAITGVMNGLLPNHTYTVYLSNGYTKYVDTGWSVAGDWDFHFSLDPNSSAWDSNLYALHFDQVGSTITGSGTYPGGQYHWPLTGSVLSNAIDFTATYDVGAPGTVMHVLGAIAPDGTMSGTWSDNYVVGGRTGAWESVSGLAVKTHSGDTGWTGLLTSSIQPFTFTTDESGSGSFHVNLRNADISSSTQELSVWINDGGTLLVSDNVSVVK